MAGKHDRAADEDAAAKLLMTGPIVIRGLSRGVKDALLPGRISRHRALDGESDEQRTDSAEQPERLLPETPMLHTDADDVEEERIAVEEQDDASRRGPDIATELETAPAAIPSTEDAAAVPDDEASPFVDGPERSVVLARAQLTLFPDVRASVEQSDHAAEVDDGGGGTPSPITSAPAAEVAQPLGAEEASDRSDGAVAPTEGEEVAGLLASTRIGGGMPDVVEGPQEEPEPVAADRVPEQTAEPDDDASETESGRTDESEQEALVSASATTEPDASSPLEGEPEPSESVGGHTSEPESEPVVGPEPAPDADLRPDQDPDPERKPASTTGSDSLGEQDPDTEAVLEAQPFEPPRSALGIDADLESPPGVPLDPGPRIDPTEALAPVVEQTAEPDPGLDRPAAASETRSTTSDEPPPVSPPASFLLPERKRPQQSDTGWLRAALPLPQVGEQQAETPALPSERLADRVDDPAPAPSAPPRPQLAPVPRPPSSTRSWGGDGPRRPSRRTGGRLGREAIGIAVLVVLALVCAGLVTAVVLKTQADAANAARESADYTPPPLTTPTPTATGPSVAIIGDAVATTGGSGVTASRLWPSLLRSSLSGTVTTLATAGSGFATKPASGSTFVEQAAQVPADADVVVFFGGAADATVSSLSVASAATNAIAAARERAPNAKVLLIGPVIDGGVSTTDLAAVRDSLSGAASIARATWVDPISARWLPQSARDADAASRLSVANETTIATKVQQEVQRALR